MFKKIMVCLDGSKLSEQILPYAVEQARRFHSQVILFHVVAEPGMVSPGIPGSPGLPVETSGSLEKMQQERNEATAYLENAAQSLRGKKLAAETVILQGAAGDAIVSYANENNIGLIAIATHGRSGLGRAVFGSVADYVLRKSGLPILVIKPQ